MYLRLYEAMSVQITLERGQCVWRDGRPVRRQQKIDLLPGLFVRRVEFANAQAHEGRLDARNDPTCLCDEHLSFTAWTFGVLLRERGNSNHFTMTSFAAEPTEEAALEHLRVEAVGFSSAMLARHGDTRGVNDVGFNAVKREPARQPEAVMTGFEGYGDALDRSPILLRLRSPLVHQLQQCP